MENGVIGIKNVLDVIFKVTKKNANNLADSYLIKDPSIISKWKTDKSKPTSDDILSIVNFTLEESSSTQRKIMRDEIDTLIDNSLLNDGIKHSLLHIGDFKEFLTEVLNVSTSVNQFSNSQYSGNSNHRELSDSLNYRQHENKTDGGTITAFSNGIDGKYSGTVEFNLVLSRDKGENGMGSPDKNNISFTSGGSFKLGNRIGKLTKHLRSKTVLGAYLLVVSGLLVVQAANSNQSIEKDANIRNIKVLSGQEKAATSIPLPTLKAEDKKNDDAVSDSSSVPSKSENNPPVQIARTSKDSESSSEDRNLSAVENNSNPDQKKVAAQNKKTSANKSSITKNDIKTTTNNISNNTTKTATNNTSNNTNDISVNNSSAATVNKDASIKGDNNVMGQGSNIFINVDN